MSERIREKVLPTLEEIAGQRTSADCEPHDDLDHLAGTWSDEEAAEFDAALAEQRKIDPELWRRPDQS